MADVTSNRSFLDVFVGRREPVVSKTTAVGVNELLPEQVFPQGAPDPVRDSDFYLDGKPLGLAISQARVAFTFRPASILAVMQDSFASDRPLIGLSAGAARGRQTPYGNRANILRDAPTTYGDLTATSGTNVSSGIYLKGDLSYNQNRQVP